MRPCNKFPGWATRRGLQPRARIHAAARPRRRIQSSPQKSDRDTQQRRAKNPPLALTPASLDKFPACAGIAASRPRAQLSPRRPPRQIQQPTQHSKFHRHRRRFVRTHIARHRHHNPQFALGMHHAARTIHHHRSRRELRHVPQYRPLQFPVHRIEMNIPSRTGFSLSAFRILAIIQSAMSDSRDTQLSPLASRILLLRKKGGRGSAAIE